jgi:hypothetical protein
MEEVKNKQSHQNIGEIILYQPDHSIRLEVRMEDETVWLNRQQMAQLFDRDVKTIGKHINNALHEELQEFSVVAIFATTASDGKTYQMEYYNLDMILSVGYRVKSQRGIQFRQWANRVLKEYLLRGYAINQRIEQVEKFAIETDRRVTETNVRLDFLRKYLEEVILDYNDINEDTRMQLELINKMLAELQVKNKELNQSRNPIGFRPYQEEPS